MLSLHQLKRTTKYTITTFAISVVIISLIGGYIGMKGNRVPYKTLPSQQYEEVTFASKSRDTMQLSGWYFPAQSQKTAVIVHGWGGNRARLLELTEYLQRNGLNVLTWRHR
jgi:hypothetical protein